MRSTFRLTPSQSSTTIDIDFEAAAIIVNNPTASPVFIRTGAPDIPTERNADVFVPAGESIAWPVSGYSFGVSFGNVGAINTSTITASGLFQTCIITLLDKTEIIPSYGSASFLSLSLSELFTAPNGGGPFTFPVMDLGAWGGAVIFIAPDGTSGQGLLKLEVSVDQITWVTAGQWAFWPSIPAILNVPRVSRYARVSTVNSGIAGEPTLSYYLTARASLAEITALTYIPFTTSISRVLNVPNLGEQDFILCTTNTPAIDISIDVTSVGSGSAAEELICETSVSQAGPWQTASFREQNSSALTGDLFRSYGNLNAFTRIRVLEIGNGGPIGGTISFSIRPEPDLSNILQLIYAALGDVGYSVNTEQDIYHTLRYIADTAILAVYNAIVTSNNYLSTIVTYDTSIYNVLSTTIHTDLTNINASIGTTNTYLSTISSNTQDMATALARSAGVVSQRMSYNPGVAGAYQSAGLVFPANWYIESATASFFCTVSAIGALPVYVELAFGTAGAAVTTFYSSYPTIFGGTIGGTDMMQGAGPAIDYGSNRSPGLFVGSNQYLWFRANDSALVLPIRMGWTIGVTP